MMLRKDMYSFTKKALLLIIMFISCICINNCPDQEPNTNLKIIGEMRFGEYSGGEIVIKGDYAYIRFAKSLMTVDISDPVHPTFLSELDINDIGDYNGLLNIWISNQLCYLTSLNSLYIVDISDPGNTILTGTMNFDNPPICLFNVDNFLFLGLLYDNSMHIINTMDPYNPYIEDTIEFDAKQQAGCHATNQLMYLADYTEFRIFNISNPLSPTIETNNYPVSMLSFTVHKDKVIYIEDEDIGKDNLIGILDVSDPSNPTLLGTITLEDSQKQLGVSDNYIYSLTNWTNKLLTVIDYQNPSSPYIVDEFIFRAYLKSIAIQGHYAYVLTDEALKIVDISYYEN